MSLGAIAAELGLSKSTVARNLAGLAPDTGITVDDDHDGQQQGASTKSRTGTSRRVRR